MIILVKEDFESPETGVFIKGTERLVPGSIGSVFIERGLAEEIKNEPVNTPEGVKEAKGDGE